MYRETIEVKTIPPVFFLGRRISGPASVIQPALEDIERTIDPQLHRGRCCGRPFVLFHSRPTERGHVDVEVAVPVEGHASASGDVHAGALGGTMVACLVHEGADLAAAYARLYQWIEVHGYVVAGPARETPIPCHQKACAPTTEIAVPIRAASG
jgi:hypothetical protein